MALVAHMPEDVKKKALAALKGVLPNSLGQQDVKAELVCAYCTDITYHY